MKDDRLLGLVRALRGALAAMDVERAAALTAPDYTEEYPQSRERLRGAAGLRRLLAAHPDPPRVVGPPRLTLVGEETVAVEEMADYGAERWWIVAIFDVAEGLVQRERAYFGRPLPRAAWRAGFVVPIPDAVSSPEPGTRGAVDRDLAERYFHAQATNDFAVLERLRHDDFVHDMPQSGERFPSARAYADAHRQYPGGLPTLTPLGFSGPRDQWVVTAATGPLRVSGRGPAWVGEAELVYPNGDRWFEILFMEFRQGKVVSERSYWAEPFDPPAWRAGLTERY